MKISITVLLVLCILFAGAQQTPFEKSQGKETATYLEPVSYYRGLQRDHQNIRMMLFGQTDAGLPLHLFMISGDNHFDPALWHKQHKIVILINNGIHPGEPDGIDASMMLARDLLIHKIALPSNVVLGIIPVYNIGGSLNRNSFSRVNQNGPISYGFRGNAQNLDLNRDFTKNDSRNSRAYAQVFHFLDPDIQIDNHVSDGADYQHIMTLIATQYDKLGGPIGAYLKNSFEPALYQNMSRKGWDMTPYVNFETDTPDKGMVQFYDPPRYSSGYAALFQTMSFMPETHMLKSFADRVKSTYELMKTMIEVASMQAKGITEARSESRKLVKRSMSFPLSWIPDSTIHTEITFKGYEQAFKTSDATGLERMYYDHSKPFTKKVNYFNHFNAAQIINKPKAYIIPQGWWAVTDILKLNGVVMNQLQEDTSIQVEAYRISDFKSYPKPYEKHHKNINVTVISSQKKQFFRKGDYIIQMGQVTDRYVVEMLEPTGDDSFFAWNFFDAILQQKEGYSDYRWEDIAGDVLKKDPELRKKMEAKRDSDPAFSKNSNAQLDFIYKNSPFYEPAHMQYPIYRIE